MKNLRAFSKLKIGLVLVLAFALTGVGLMRQGSAASSGLYLSGPTSVQKGNNVTLNLYLNHGTADGVEATLAYDQAKLQFVSVSGGGSAFALELQNSGGGGTVQIARGAVPSVSGNVLAVKVTFKALVGGTSSLIDMTAGNATNGGGYTNPALNDFTLSLTNPVTTDPAPPKPQTNDDSDNTNTGGSDNSGGDDTNTGGSGGSGSGSGGDTSTTGSGNCKDIKIENKRIGLTRATLRTILTKNCRVYIQFGTEKNQLKVSTKLTKPGKTHDITLDEKFIVPGTTFFYKIVAEDEKGNKTESKVASFKTKGYKVRLVIRDALGQALKNKKVTLRSEPMEGTTDENGQVTFDDVAPGNHSIEYEQGGEVYAETVAVQVLPVATAPDGSQSADEQDLAVTLQQLQSVASDSTPAIVPAGIALALVLLGAATFVIIKRRRQTPQFVPAQQSTPVTPSPTAAPSQGDQGDDLINRVSQSNGPDPGSIVNPNHNDEDEKK